ncbi:exonuclease [Halalkalibacter wakoensis JCM 9140]|uniref:Exonuclease n=1 Tax=Halalkalibacter wakoensis JCM 9140 TaxID=1236970 RepID=W4PZR3_9BACI|nr:3'-5' exonuclease [Halalkalibacter wakoensis]GAE25190.1 exonuclease [Halalkalibacter wakoensis JCM 9140]
MAELKQFIFFDFEMLCSDEGMSFESMEAIRLGAVKYNLQTKEVLTFDEYIKPLSTKPLSEFCKELTGIDNQHLADASSFQQVLEQFLTWVGGIKKSRFFSWSPSDLHRLKVDSRIHGIPSSTIAKIEKRYVDFQEIFTKRVSKTNASVESALQLYGLDFIGEKHHPMYDSYNTLRIYLKFLDEPIQSDLIMLNQFIFEQEPLPFNKVNAKLNHKILEDFSQLLANDVIHMKEARKILKKTSKLVKKYNNVLINRSGLFTDENIKLIEELVAFYHDFLNTFNEHHSFSSKVLILDHYITTNSTLYLKQG